MRLEAMNDDLFSETELRSFLKAPPDLSADPAFERAVLERIRRAERRAVIVPSAVALTLLVALVICLWPVFSGLPVRAAHLLAGIRPLLSFLRSFQNLFASLVICAQALGRAMWLESRALLFLGVIIFVVAALARLLADRIRTTRPCL